MAVTVPHTDVLLTVMGAPHENDLVTTVFRMSQAFLDHGASVQVWACGYATMLTHRGMGESKPRNLAAWSTDHPSPGRLVRELTEEYPERFHWYVCRFCSDDRGAAGHLPEVLLRAPAKFADHVAAADKALFLGVM